MGKYKCDSYQLAGKLLQSAEETETWTFIA